MGLSNSTCDSCGEAFDILFPVAILDELVTGGMGMVQRWYCINCKSELEDEATEKADKDDEDDEDMDDDEKDKPTPEKEVSIFNLIPKVPWPFTKEKLEEARRIFIKDCEIHESREKE